jgi:alkaline phosphatase D
MAATWVPCVYPSFRKFSHQKHKSLTSRVVIVMLTLPMGSRRLRLFSLLINSLLLLASIEFVVEDYLHDAPDVVFTRLGAVYPDRVKLAMRYPYHTDPIHVVWRKVRESSDLQAQPWILGPPIMLSGATDWVNSTTISPLWPNTMYECNSLTLFASTLWFLRSIRFAGDLG